MQLFEEFSSLLSPGIYCLRLSHASKTSDRSSYQLNLTKNSLEIVTTTRTEKQKVCLNMTSGDVTLNGRPAPADIYMFIDVFCARVESDLSKNRVAIEVKEEVF